MSSTRDYRLTRRSLVLEIISCTDRFVTVVRRTTHNSNNVCRRRFYIIRSNVLLSSITYCRFFRHGIVWTTTTTHYACVFFFFKFIVHSKYYIVQSRRENTRFRISSTTVKIVRVICCECTRSFNRRKRTRDSRRHTLLRHTLPGIITSTIVRHKTGSVRTKSCFSK